MSDAAVVDAQAEPVAAPVKVAKPAKTPKKKVAKPKTPANHPKYSEMIRDALTGLKERGGSSRQKILKYIVANFNVGKDEKIVNNHLKMALKAGVKNETLKQAKGTGASGSFRLGQSKPEKAKKAKKPAAAKPKVKKAPKKVKKSPAKKSKPDAAKKAKKVSVKPKAEKKAVKAKPKKVKSPKKATKPKAKKSPKKAAAKK